MAKLTINPTSIYKNSRENFVLNKDALYTFTRTISAINNSVYGIQPTKAQYISGIAIEDISATHSLCSDVYFMEQNMDAVKYFFSRNFVVCDNVADRNEKANNPFAVYLTPVVPENTDETAETLNVDTGSEAMTAFENNDHYEWIYVLPESLSSFEDMKDIYLSCLNGTKLTSFGGKWELIGSTSLTDEKIASLFRDVNETIETNVRNLYEAIAAETAARKEADNEITSMITAYAADFDDKLNTEAAERKAADEALENELTAFASDLNSRIDQEIHDRISADDEIKDNLATEVLRAIAAENQLRNDIVAEAAERKAADEALEDRLTAFADDLENKINNEISERKAADEALENELTAAVSDLNDKLNNETTERIAADNALRRELTAYVSDIDDRLSTETRERKAADQDLSDRLNRETTERIGDISVLRNMLTAFADDTNNKLANEESERKAADDELTNRINQLTAFSSDLNDKIDQEKEDRENADANLQDQLNELTAFADDLERRLENEAAERKEADEAIENELTAAVSDLEDKIDNETSERKDADEELADRINQLTAFSTDLEDALTAEIEDRQKADQEIIDSLTAYILSVGPAEESETELTSDFDNYRYRFYQGGREVGYIDIAKDQFVEDADFQGTILVLHLRGGQTISTDLKDVVDVLHGSTTDTISVYVNAETNEIAATLVEKYALLEDFENEVEEREAADEAIMTAFVEFKDAVEISAANLCAEISSTNENLNAFVDLLTDELSSNINPKLSTIAECVSAEVKRVDEISAKLSGGTATLTVLSGIVDNILTSSIPILSTDLTNTISAISSDLSGSLSNYVEKEDLSSKIAAQISGYNDYVISAPTSISTIINWTKAIHLALSSLINL